LNPTVLATMFVVFLGCFTQSLSGFGVALVTMALLPSLIGLRVATPLVALVGIVLEVMILIRYHASIKFKSILGLIVPSVVAIPLGVKYLRMLDERVALFILGLIVLTYALYALIGFRLPELRHPSWAMLFGFMGGLLSGAYNTSGPPVVVYGNCRKWSPEEFKSNLAGYFLINSVMTVSTHWLSGHFTADVWITFWWTLPALVIGFALGQSIDRWLNPELFRRIVLVMLVILGLRLML
jgi:uncharacterized membrane protein YfcA